MKIYTKRQIYIDKIKPFIDKDIIKVLVWQRRCGKSYILYQLMDELVKLYKVRQSQIIYINKELNEFDKITSYQELLDYIKNTGSTKKENQDKTYIFIDEIQDIIWFEKALRDLQAIWWYDIYISGSNANLLSSEIATYLTGRYIEFTIFPLNYIEFLQFHKLINSKESFLKYMTFGWLPYLINLELDQNITGDYIKSVYNTILLKDIIRRYNIRNVDFMDRLMVYISDNIWQLFTANNISLYLKSQKVDINTNVVLNYVNYLSSVFLINKVKRFDIVGKKLFEVSEKIYFSDLGIRNMLIWWYKQTDISKILENIIYIHFRSLWYDVYIWKLWTKEIDFVVTKWNDKKYIQVCYLLADQSTIDREFWNLLQIKDNYEKIVLSMDDFISWDYQGIKHYNIIDYVSNFSN